MRRVAVLFLAVFAGGLAAAPPAIVSLNPSPANPPPSPAPPGALRVTPGKIQVLKLDGVTAPVQWNVVQPIGPGGARRVVGEAVVVPKGGFVLGWMEGEAKPGVKRYEFETLALMGAGGSGYVVVQAQVVEDGVIKTVAELVVEVLGDGTDPIPPPKPKPEPKPEPVSSFRAIFVYESGSTLTLEQKAVVYSKDVADYLNQKATKENGLAGWRRFDRDENAANEQPTMKALWGAVKPKVTGVPCLAVEVNGRVEIVPLPATPAEAVKLLKKYNGEE